MAGTAGTAVRAVAALTLSVVADLSLFYASGRFASAGASGRLARLWVLAALRCLAPCAATRLCLGRLEPNLIRWAVTHSLLPAVLESGSRALRRDETRCALAADARCWWMCAGASLAAALFWEVTVPGEGDAGGDRGARRRSRELFVRVVLLYRPYYHLLLGGLLFLSLAVIFDMFIPFYTGKIVDILGQHYQASEFMSAVLFMALYSIGSSVSAGCRGGLLLWAISSFICRIKVKVFGALTKQEIAFFEKVKPGEITSRLSKDTDLMAKTVCLNVNVMLRTLIKTVGVIYFMLNLSWKLTLLVLMEVPVTGMVQNVYDTRYQRLTRAIQDALAVLSDTVNEAMSGIRVIRGFKAEEHEARRYDGRLMDIVALRNQRDTVRAVYLLVYRLTGLSMQVLMLYYGRLFIQNGQMTTGSLVSFILYQSELGDCIRGLVANFGNMMSSVGAAGKVFEFLDRQPLISTAGTLKPEQLRGHVSFRRLNFAYPSRPDKSVLQDFSLELRPGQMTALVGPSGEGKTTSVSLLERLYEPQEGEILLDDEPLKAYDHRYLHQKMALVNQEPVLFSGSIRDNIAYGLASCPMEEIQEAARKANAHDFILKLTDGYDTELGQGRGLLSKSERQRIAIARALVRRPQVLILDEMTSCLDAESENKVQQSLAGCPSQTVLVIAHRLKTIERADQIVVIKAGGVQERGTHQELMDKKGSYYQLKEEIFSKEDKAPEAN